MDGISHERPFIGKSPTYWRNLVSRKCVGREYMVTKLIGGRERLCLVCRDTRTDRKATDRLHLTPVPEKEDLEAVVFKTRRNFWNHRMTGCTADERFQDNQKTEVYHVAKRHGRRGDSAILY